MKAKRRLFPRKELSPQQPLKKRSKSKVCCFNWTVMVLVFSLGEALDPGLRWGESGVAGAAGAAGDDSFDSVG